jgi:hypothetical protein
MQARLVSPSLTGEELYYANRYTSNILSLLETMKLLAGDTRPEYTKSTRLLMEVRYAKVTWMGRVAGHFPSFVRQFAFMVFLQRNRVTALLGVISLGKFLLNAYHGVKVFAGWSEYAAALVIGYILYTAFMRLVRST